MFAASPRSDITDQTSPPIATTALPPIARGQTVATIVPAALAAIHNGAYKIDRLITYAATVTAQPMRGTQTVDRFIT